MSDVLCRGTNLPDRTQQWFPDVVIQVASATRALQEAAVGLLSDQLRHCVTSVVHGRDGEAAAAIAQDPTDR